MPDPAAVTAPLDVLFGPLEPAGPRVGADTGEPMMSSLVIHAHGSVEVGVWECTPGGWPILDRPTTETMLLLGGSVRITPLGGEPVDLGEGDVFVLPKGWSGRWDVLDTVRKLFVLVD